MEFVQFLMIENKCGFSLHTHKRCPTARKILAEIGKMNQFLTTLLCKKKKNVKRKMMPSRFQPIWRWKSLIFIPFVFQIWMNLNKIKIAVGIFRGSKSLNEKNGHRYLTCLWSGQSAKYSKQNALIALLIIRSAHNWIVSMSADGTMKNYQMFTVSEHYSANLRPLYRLHSSHSLTRDPRESKREE